MKLYHGSEKQITTDTIKEGYFHGMFFSYTKEDAVGLASPKFLYSTEIEESDIIDASSFIYDDVSWETIKNKYGENAELLGDLISGERIIWDGLDDDEMNIVEKTFPTADGNAEIDWMIQKAAAEIADTLGYKAVEVQDEHGASVIVLPGNTIKLEGEI